LGTVIDPSADCRLSIRDGALTIAVPGSDYALAVAGGRTDVPRVLREIRGDFCAQFKVSPTVATDATSDCLQ